MGRRSFFQTCWGSLFGLQHLTNSAGLPLLVFKSGGLGPGNPPSPPGGGGGVPHGGVLEHVFVLLRLWVPLGTKAIRNPCKKSRRLPPTSGNDNDHLGGLVFPRHSRT